MLSFTKEFVMSKEEKKLAICTDIEKIDLSSLTKTNIYKNVVLCSKRAQQIDSAQNNKRREKLKDWEDYNHRFSFLRNDDENIPQKISRTFEKLDKATNIAIEEFEEGKIKEVNKKAFSDCQEIENGGNK